MASWHKISKLALMRHKSLKISEDFFNLTTLIYGKLSRKLQFFEVFVSSAKLTFLFKTSETSLGSILNAKLHLYLRPKTQKS